LLACVEAEFNALQTDLLGAPYVVPRRLAIQCKKEYLKCEYQGIVEELVA
jgi:hypothetical protein